MAVEQSRKPRPQIFNSTGSRLMNTSIALKTLLGAGALMLPLLASAESNVQTGAATATPGATAHVDFTIVIPKILYLRVGTGSAYASGSALTSVNTVDLITFSPAAGTVGNGTAVAGTGGDLTGGVETAAIVSNSGAVTLSSTASAAGLSDGNGDNILFTQITTAATTLTSGTALAAPALGTAGTVIIPAPASKLISQDAKWTYSYANSVNAPAGTYGGANGVNNGRVVYTATMP
jgi:hypothetical protein